MIKDTDVTTRREDIRKLVIGTLGLWVHWKPTLAQAEKMMSGAAFEDKTIRAFIETIVPGTDTAHPNLTVVFQDPGFGFGQTRWLFNCNLRNRALKKCGTLAFHKLSYDQKAAIIRDGLEDHGRISQLYSAAVFAAQLTVLTGFYKKEPCCPLINFREGPDIDEIYYPDGQKFFTNATKTDGNFAYMR